MKIKKLLIIICAMLLVLSATGCGSSPNADDTAAVMAALDKFNACESFTVVQVTHLQESVKENNVKTVYDCINEKEISLITKPSAQMITSTLDSVDYDDQHLEQFTISYIVPENGGYTEYYNDGSQWYKVSIDDGDALAGLGADSMTASFFADKLSYRKLGEETLDSGKAVRYEGMLSGDALMAMLELSGHLSGIESMSEKQQTSIMDNLRNDLKEMPVYVWVDQASGYPVCFQANLCETLKQMDKSVNKTLGSKAQEWTLSDYTITMTTKNFNALDQVVLPPDAADAEFYEAGSAE